MDKQTERRIEALEANEAKKKRIFTAITVLLVVIFLGGIWLGIQNVLLAEGTEEPPAPAPVFLTEQPQTAQDTLDYYAALLSNAAAAGNEGRMKLSAATRLSVEDDGLTVEPTDDALTQALRYAGDEMLARLQERYPDEESGFGEDCSERLPSASFTADMTLSADCETQDGGTERILRFTFPDAALTSAEAMALAESFGLRQPAEAAQAIKDFFADIVEVKDADVVCSGFSIEAKADGATDQLTSVTLTRRYEAESSVSFTGVLGEVGERRISLPFTAEKTYTFSWAGLRLAKETLWMEKGKTEHLEAFCTADEKIAVRWESSDPEIAVVDDEGYIKGKRVSAQPVTITATMEYLGHTYTDQCKVWVRKPVKKAAPKERDVTLRLNETKPLLLKISPGSATVRNAYWISADPSIVTVNEQGEVTGVSPGVAEVTAITWDGNYKSTFTVTVEGGGADG